MFQVSEQATIGLWGAVAIFSGLCIAAKGVLYWQQKGSNVVKALAIIAVAILFIVAGSLMMQY